MVQVHLQMRWQMQLQCSPGSARFEVLVAICMFCSKGRTCGDAIWAGGTGSDIERMI
ncbi:hypothetical protein GCM10012279_47120 [Micromonospora yangpuensis]|nr:hypothetical protein GCM10012279_47120 [Micromonospora yangpuensis]